MGSTLPDVQQSVAAAAARLNSAESEADFLAAAELFEAVLEVDPGYEPATYGLEQAQKGREMQRVAAAAARLNSAESEADFLAAAELFEAVLKVDPGCEPATYGLEQAQKGRDMLAQQRREESKASRWSLRAGRSAVAGFSKLREGAQRSIAELSDLSSMDLAVGATDEPEPGPELEQQLEPEPEPEPEPDPERGGSSTAVVTENCQAAAVPPSSIIEDAHVETFLSQMDTLIQELDESDDEHVTRGGDDPSCSATVSNAETDVAVLSSPVPHSTPAPIIGLDPGEQEADGNERVLRAEAIE
eukprot:COSAG02_NODE_527_length_20704_cov_120.745462_8_plen_302_part_00